ncbi:hypothetical protein Ccrd_025054 [Cynara cardunculus var. scolymus]|uniref:Uncharacterized protein n=1 Tax=Cynara cardunculus var. scolymus TaxID=59895 RepID=A0A103XBH4_CYNCS|nr:hypothetical protein Ccrd_025054 [Cynara cardunculus var. scolymus]
MASIIATLAIVLPDAFLPLETFKDGSSPAAAIKETHRVRRNSKSKRNSRNQVCSEIPMDIYLMKIIASLKIQAVRAVVQPMITAIASSDKEECNSIRSCRSICDEGEGANSSRNFIRVAKERKDEESVSPMEMLLVSTIEGAILDEK